MSKNHQDRKNKARWFVGFIVLLVAAGSGSFWFSACSGRSDTTPEVKKTVTIGLARSPLAQIISIAEENGFFRDQGLEVLIKSYASGKSAQEGLFDNEVDLATISDVRVVMMSFMRDDFQIVASTGSSDNEPRVIARQDRGIQEPEDLRGKRVATHRGSAVHFFLHNFLAKNRLSDDDVSIIFRKDNALPGVLAKGEVDAIAMREPFISKAAELLGGKVIFFAEPGIYLKTINLVAFDRFIRSESDTIRRLLLALVVAEKWTREHPQQAIRIVAKSLDLDESAMAALWPELDLRISLDQAMLRSLSEESRWAINSGLTDKKTAPNYLDLIYIDGLAAVHPEAVTIIR